MPQLGFFMTEVVRFSAICFFGMVGAYFGKHSGFGEVIGSLIGANFGYVIGCILILLTDRLSQDRYVRVMKELEEERRRGA